MQSALLSYPRAHNSSTSEQAVAVAAPMAPISESPDGVGTRRRRRWVGVVADIIFAALCMVITGFFISVLGVFGVLFYLTS